MKKPLETGCENHRPPQPPDLLLIHAAELVTISEKGSRPVVGRGLEDLGIIPDGAVAASGGRIVGVGATDDVMRAFPPGPDTQVLDVSGQTVIPGFVDPHTHLVYAGSREHEFGKKLRGIPYLDILAEGGGILSTVRATRAAGEQDLLEQSRRRLRAMIAHGTTTVEAKSGYGLNLDDELKQLRVAETLAAHEPVNIVSTFMAAHALPPEYADHRDGYVRLIADSMIPRVAQQGLARFCDVFFEAGVFDERETRAVLQAARQAGMGLKLHADEITDLGGAALAAELGAISADHLLKANDDGLRGMAAAGTVAVLLPGTAFSLMVGEYARARDMIALGVPVALATDCNPGSSPTESMPMVLNLAAFQMRMTPAEALIGATLNAAHALGLASRVGSIEPGKQADFAILEVPNHLHLFYHYGTNPVKTVIHKGRVVCRNQTAG